ncbi:hypothetical protein P3342_011274 [Pyrenophora teres f. teres]|nr:hypothetical protein P3342_011274 [Pyrenophora teres f. teres]
MEQNGTGPDDDDHYYCCCSVQSRTPSSSSSFCSHHHHTLSRPSPSLCLLLRAFRQFHHHLLRKATAQSPRNQPPRPPAQPHRRPRRCPLPPPRVLSGLKAGKGSQKSQTARHLLHATRDPVLVSSAPTQKLMFAIGSPLRHRLEAEKEPSHWHLRTAIQDWSCCATRSLHRRLGLSLGAFAEQSLG